MSKLLLLQASSRIMTMMDCEVNYKPFEPMFTIYNLQVTLYSIEVEKSDSQLSNRQNSEWQSCRNGRMRVLSIILNKQLKHRTNYCLVFPMK